MRGLFMVRRLSMADILAGKVNPPRTSASFLSTVQKYAGRMKQKD